VVPTPLTRVLDTRNGTGTGGKVAHLGANQSLVLRIAGRNGVPATGATAAELNVTVTNDAAGGYISAYPDGVARPNASTLNFAPHQIVANASITTLGTDGAIRLYNHSNAPVDLVIDQTGYFYAYPGLS
ncbi:MAG: PKD domain-containing protein, partial [Streptomyces sp.]|nr:PKD domain-containing protein [Streptomyces sp.]